jgi:mannose-6-phosphate isomerase-like protein (cupin superfamily)
MKFEDCQTVSKGWGHEVVIVNTPLYCGKILHFNTGAKFSMHFHMKKTETWYIQSGRFHFRWIDTTNADILESMLVAGDCVTIHPGDPHQLACVESGDVYEFSTEHFDSDSYRVQKGDSQAKDVSTLNSAT